MDTEREAELRALLDNIWPYLVTTEGNEHLPLEDFYPNMKRQVDAAYIVLSPRLVRELLDDVDGVRKVLIALVNESAVFARSASWSSYSCEYCGGEAWGDDPIGHYPDCPWSAAKKLLGD